MMRKPSIALPWLIVTLWWGLYLVLLFPIYTSHPNGAGDFGWTWRGAERVIHNIPLYENMTSQDYNYPPLLAQLVSPVVARFDRQTTNIIWYGFNSLLFFVTLGLLTRYIPDKRSRLIFWLAPAAFMPVYMSLFLGQSTFIQTILIAGAWMAYKDKKPAITGALLAGAVWTKFYPGLLLIYFVWKREWRVTISGLISTVFLVVFQIAVSGFDAFRDYFVEVLPDLAVHGQPELNHSNHSIVAFAEKLFSVSPQIDPLLISPALMHLTRFGLTIAIMGLLLYLSSRPASLQKTPPDQFDLEYALTLLSALLIGSTLGVHAMLPTLLVLFVLFRSRYGLSAVSRTRLKLITLLAVILINVHWFIIWGYVMPPSEAQLPALVLSLPFFGMLLLWGMVAYLLYKQRRLAAVPAILKTALA